MKTNYRNVFKECGFTDEQIENRLKEIKEEFFFGKDRVYFTTADNMGYVVDTGNIDVRTEGMSYAMMLCVQLNMQEDFDRIWRWAKTYMYMTEGENEGYFAWSCKTDGEKNANGPAPDGEEFFAMALYFASHRWGDKEGIFAYSKEADAILTAMVHKGYDGRKGAPMVNHDNYQILFVPGIDFTDPSYHLPHFYNLFSKWGPLEDREFWEKATEVSRKYLYDSCDKTTGFSAEYAEFDGSPMSRPLPWTTDRHDWFYSDAYRTVANIALDYEWNKIDVGQCAASKNIQRFLLIDQRRETFFAYEVTGKATSEPALHPVGLLATVAQGALATELDDVSKEWVMKFFNTPMRKGERRYYDNCLYFFAFLALSGNYRMW
ncbi:MAG: xylanase [Lachnospiraceae bacterium]|nr:xylanase [Lachnospiraceae bacterium]